MKVKGEKLGILLMFKGLKGWRKFLGSDGGIGWRGVVSIRREFWFCYYSL